MAKRTREQYVSQMRKTADFWRKKGDKAYAKYKSYDSDDDCPEKWKYYHESQRCYEKAKEFEYKAEHPEEFGY